MIVSIFFLTIGFVVLIVGANWLVNGSVSLAKRNHIPEIAIGMTVVAFGTSLPELVVNIQASLKELNDVTTGNIIGSNLFNLMFILGVSGVIYPLKVKTSTIKKEIPVSLFAVLILFIISNDFLFNQAQGKISLFDGIILLLLFIGFLIYLSKNFKPEQVQAESGYKIHSPLKTITFIIAGLIALVAGSKLVVSHAVDIAEILNISQKTIGLTIIATGTSLPELMTSVVSAIKKQSDIAIGNVIGSNIFNIFLILGVSGIIHPIVFNREFNFDIIVLFIATSWLLTTMFTGKKAILERWESLILLSGYITYIYYMLAIN